MKMSHWFMNVLPSQTGCSEYNRAHPFLYEHEGIHLDYAKIEKNKRPEWRHPRQTIDFAPRPFCSTVMVVEQNQLFVLGVSIRPVYSFRFWRTPRGNLKGCAP